MAGLKYTLVKTKKQYATYCDVLENLKSKPLKNKQEEIALLELLIEKWEEQHSPLTKMDPVEVLKYCMQQHQLKQKDIVTLLGVSKGLVSDILAYKKGFSKESIRILADHFKIKQEAFNRVYPLLS